MATAVLMEAFKLEVVFVVLEIMLFKIANLQSWILEMLQPLGTLLFPDVVRWKLLPSLMALNPLEKKPLKIVLV